MKRIIHKLFIFAVLASLCFLLWASPVFAEGEQRVYDMSGLFSAEETAALEARIAELRAQYPVDFVILTSDTTEGKESVVYADDFYDREDLAFGGDEDYSGILYFIDMDNRVPTISTCGVMIDYITDSRLEELLDGVYNDLPDGNFAQSAMVFLDMTQSYIEAGIPAGQYRYDVETGEVYPSSAGIVPVRSLSLGEVIVAAVVALVAFLIKWIGVHRKYRLKGRTYRYDLQKNGSIELTNKLDNYIRTTETRRRINTDSGGGFGGGGGGSGIRFSGGGRMHGGGSGRRF